MAIISRKEKRTISPWISGVVLVITLSIATYIVYPEAPERGEVTLSAKAKAMLATAGQSPVTEVYTPSDTTHAEVLPEVRQDVHVVSADTVASSPLRYGADAIGAEGAWDGRSADGTQVAHDDAPKDQFGNLCESYRIPDIPSARLRAMLPPMHIEDECQYRFHYLERVDTPPADVLQYAGRVVFGVEEIRRFVRSGQWSLGDLEALAGKDLATTGALSLYLVLKRANSPVATYLLNRHDDAINRSSLDKFLETGECFDSSASPENFCLRY